MKFIPTDLPGVMMIEPRAFKDDRGFFFESYNKEIFSKNGIHEEFVQDNHSVSHRGVLRGLHYQVAPKAQSKLVGVVRGEAFDVVVDIRKGSKTFGRYVSHLLSAENGKMLYIPVGFAHGFLALKEDTEFLYKVSYLYSPEAERGVIWNDASIGIQWPKLEVEFILSDKDKKNPALKRVISH